MSLVGRATGSLNVIIEEGSPVATTLVVGHRCPLLSTNAHVLRARYVRFQAPDPAGIPTFMHRL
jgi:hypothetical protein